MLVAVAEPRPDGGVTVAEISLKFLWDALSRRQLGDAGYAYVVDARGRLLAHPDIALVLKDGDVASLPQVQAALASTAVSQETPALARLGHDLAGGRVLATHAAIDPPGWLLVVEQPFEETLLPVYRSLAWTGALALLVVLCWALLSRLSPVRG